MRYTKEIIEKKKEYNNLEPNNLLEKTSYKKRNFFNGKNQKYIQNNIYKPKFRYYNNDENNSIKKNKSCPKLNSIEQDSIKDKNDNDNYIYSDLYIDSYNDSNNSKYENNQLNNIHLTKGRYMPMSNFNSQKRDYLNKNPDYNYECNNNIFTRIVPKIDNNDSNIIIPKKLNYPQQSVIYKYSKNKTPNKPHYNRKKKNNDNNIYNKSSNSKEQTSLNNYKYINETTNNIFDTKNDSSSSFMSENSKRYIELIGNISDLDKSNKNGYIELFTLNDIKNINKINKLQQLKGLNIPKNQRHILIQTLSSMNNSFNSINNSNSNSNNNSNRNYENSNTIKYYPRKNNFLVEQKEEGKKSSRMTLSKITKKNKPNKSYNCIVFKEKNGLKMRKKNKNKRRNKTHDILQEDNENRKGTPIKKEDDKGGKVILYQNNLINYNRNIKEINLDQKEKESKSCNEYNYIYKKIMEVTRIQKWWRKITYKIFIKKVIIIQKIFRSYFSRKSQNNNFEDKYIYKRPKNKVYFITKDNKLSYGKIIFIQKAFRKYLISKLFDKSLFNTYKRPKNICKIITKKRFLKKKNNNNAIIKFKNNNLKYAQSPKNKKHQYTKSKLSPITINKILLNESEIKYETNNYTYFKKCNFRKPRFEEIDDEDKEIERPLTCEIMRKINFKWNKNKKNLTPEIKRNNININYSLKIIRLSDIQYKNIKKNRNDKKKLENSLNKSKINKCNKNLKNKDNLYENNNKLKKNSEKNNQSKLKKINGENNNKINLIKINENNLNNANFSKNNFSDFNGQKRNNININFGSFSKSHEIYVDEKYNNKNADILRNNNSNLNILNNNLNFNINKKNDIIHNNNNRNLNNNDIKIQYNKRNNFNNLKNSQKSNDSINNKYNENNINFTKNKNDNFNNQNIHNFSNKIKENNSFNIHNNSVYSFNDTKVSTYKIDNNKSNNEINYSNEYENKNNINDNKKIILNIKNINNFNMLNDFKNSSFQDNNIQNDYNNNFIYTSNSKRNYKSDTGRIELRENKWDSNSLKSSESNL